MKFACRPLPVFILSSLWLIAFCCALMPLEAYEAHGFFLAFVLLSALVAQVILQEGQAIRFNALLCAGFAFWLLTLVSMAFSEMPYVSFIYFCFFSVMPLSFLLTLLLQQKDRFFYFAAWGHALIFAALAIFSFVQFLFMPGWLEHGLVHWPFADPNSFAGIFSLAFFCAFALMLAGRSKIQSNAGLGLSFLFLQAILMSGSKGAMLALAAGLLVFVIAAWKQVRRHWRCCALLAAGTIAVFALLGMGSTPQARNLLNNYLVNPGMSEREGLLLSAWEIIQAHFWTGTGIGTFFLYYPSYRNEADSSTAGFMVHNDPLQFFAEMGVLAPFLFYGFIILAIIRTVKALRFLAATDERRIYILAPFCALGAMVAHTHINFHFNILPTLMFSGLLLGFWYARTGDHAAQPLSKNTRGFLAFGCVALALGFTMIQGGEILVDRARERLERGDLPGFAADINLAGTISLNTNARAMGLAASIPLGLLETSRDMNENEGQKQSVRIKELLDKAEALNPRMPAIFYLRARLSMIAASGTQHETPENLLAHALALDSMHIPSRILLARILLQKGQKKEALDLMKAGQDWPNAGIPYFEAMADIAGQAGDQDAQDTALAKMLIAQGRQYKVNFREQGMRSYEVAE